MACFEFFLHMGSPLWQGKLSLARCGNQLFFLCILTSQIAGKVDIFVLSRVLTDLEFI